jgi:hypothetical protein
MDVLNPNKTYRVALIGTGWYGKSDLLWQIFEIRTSIHYSSKMVSETIFSIFTKKNYSTNK